ncbi:hypothetical protein PG993_006338 [Apiospora rasikravindrae]|uniref:Uncharacterized protein n=1 Tax=Apiospora rasikravindrae TaxID=990691 RepID=A0ABR1T5E9_9PEZI
MAEECGVEEVQSGPRQSEKLEQWNVPRAVRSGGGMSPDNRSFVDLISFSSRIVTKLIYFRCIIAGLILFARIVIGPIRVGQ